VRVCQSSSCGTYDILKKIGNYKLAHITNKQGSTAIVRVNKQWNIYPRSSFARDGDTVNSGAKAVTTIDMNIN